MYGDLEVRLFSPSKLKAVRERMVSRKLARKTINQRIGQIKRMFGWGAEEELVPGSVWHGLLAVKRLKKGRSEAREPKPIGPVPDAAVEATLPYLPPVVADMVRFQRLTGARPSEVCELRPIDVERGTDPWAYRPASHKTEHHGKERVIFIGPRAQAILTPYLLRPAEECCFSPADSERRRLQERAARRKAPVTPSQRKRAKQASCTTVGNRYDKDSYGKAVRRAIGKANFANKKASAELFPEDVNPIEHWSPNRLRHSAGTELRQRFDVETAQVVLGHSELKTTEIYAERDLAKAAAAMRQIG
jgi:integrase